MLLAHSQLQGGLQAQGWGVWEEWKEPTEGPREPCSTWGGCNGTGTGAGGACGLPQPIALELHPSLACHKFSAPVLQVEQSKKCLRAGGSGFPEPSDLGNIEGQEQLRTERLLVPWGKQQKSHCWTLESSY